MILSTSSSFGCWALSRNHNLRQSGQKSSPLCLMKSEIVSLMKTKAKNALILYFHQVIVFQHMFIFIVISSCNFWKEVCPNSLLIIIKDLILPLNCYFRIDFLLFLQPIYHSFHPTYVLIPLFIFYSWIQGNNL